MPGPTDAELACDAKVFRALKRHHMTEHEKHELLALTKAGYRAYQQRLMELAQRYHVRIPTIKD